MKTIRTFEGGKESMAAALAVTLLLAAMPAVFGDVSDRSESGKTIDEVLRQIRLEQEVGHNTDIDPDTGGADHSRSRGNLRRCSGHQLCLGDAPNALLPKAWSSLISIPGCSVFGRVLGMPISPLDCFS